MERLLQLPERTYRNKTSVKLVYLMVYPIMIALIIILVVSFLLINLSASQRLLNLFGIALCIFTLYINSAIANIRFEISQEGVAYYGSSLHVFTPWQNVAGITRVEYPYKGKRILVNAFVFKSPALFNISISEGKRRTVAVIEKYWRIIPAHPEAYTRYLPIFIDGLLTAPDISSHEITTCIRQYAPQLLGEAREQ